jgi:hypothetical protein
MNKKQRGEVIWKRAKELAQSGAHEDWMTIEIALRHEGFPEARQVLDSSLYRQELNEMCKSARQSGS